MRALLLIYRGQIERGRFDERIRSFFAEQAELRIWSSEEPVAAMPEFLGKQKRGAPRRSAMRHFELAAEIQELCDGGKSVEVACEPFVSGYKRWARSPMSNTCGSSISEKANAGSANGRSVRGRAGRASDLD